ncbi:MAG: SnoaL-like domain [Thermoleophilia bacterium]|nr:SnoaL-like domain [Thermoleophilia bacterium]MCZ4495996.1 SnoaL-like domain [Thermoleophilia bacterium]
MTMDPDVSSAELVTRHVVGQVINSIAARDWTSLNACVSPDIVYWRPGTNDRVDGAQGYVAEWQRFVESTSRLDYRPHTVIVQGDTAMVEATAEGVYATGEPLHFSMVTIMRIEGGRLAEEREYIVPRS